MVARRPEPARLDPHEIQNQAQAEFAERMYTDNHAEAFWMERGEARGLEKGVEQGKLESKREGLYHAIESILDVRFGVAGMALMPRIRQLTVLAELGKWPALIVAAQSVASLDALLPREISNHAE